MPTLQIHNVSRESYDAIDVLELHGPTAVWKSLWFDDLQIIWFPGPWRNELLAVVAADVIGF